MYVKQICLMNIKDMNFLPTFEQWYRRYHLPEAYGMFSTNMVDYKNWRAVPYCPNAPFMPEDGKRIGYYNYRLAEIVTDTEHLMTYSKGHTAVTYPIKILEGFMGFLPSDNTPYTTDFMGQPDGAHPTAHCYVPEVPTEDYLGMDLTTDGVQPLRWYIVHKYPKGVSVEEGEKWWKEVHAKEILEMPGLMRFFSYRAVEMPKSYMIQQTADGSQYPFQRVTELWFKDFAAWRNAVIDNPPKFTKPDWATYDQYPFLQPYVDFCSSFFVRQADWNLQDLRPMW